MKKLNNKGFAITTVIYGLAILGILLMSVLMSTLSQTRVNNADLSKSIEDELNRFSQTSSFFEGTIDSDNYPMPQEYVVPSGESGWYKIQLWGAQGGNNGGLGAYTSGVIHLSEGDKLYFYIGKKISNKQGSESDVRIVRGGYNDQASYQSRIMVAAGGGYGEGADGGTLYGYNASMSPQGGEVDCESSVKTYGILANDKLVYSNGSLIGSPKNYVRSTITQNTVTSPIGTSKGGDGYYASNDQNVGGVSFISGYAGSKAIIQGAISNRPSYELSSLVYNDDTNTYEYSTGDESRRYSFVDGIMLPGVQKGNGKAKIERVLLSTEATGSLPRKNTKLDNVRYIKDCLDTDDSSGVNTTFSAITDTQDLGINPDVAFEKPVTASGKCRIVDLGVAYKLEELAVWHENGDGKDPKNHTIEVSADNTNWLTVKGIAGQTPYSETETVAGFHISAYQFDATADFPVRGNYILMPVLSANKAVTAQETAEVDSDQIGIEKINGQKTQTWAIELITDPDLLIAGSTTREFKLSETARNKSLEIYEQENIPNNKVAASTIFNHYQRNEPQIWQIEKAGNGTYYIRTSVLPHNPAIPSGNIYAQTNKKITDSPNKLMIGKNNADTQRFKIISVDYSSNV